MRLPSWFIALEMFTMLGNRFLLHFPISSLTPSFSKLHRNKVIDILPFESATVGNGPQEVMKGGCNETTHYLSRRGICCELCQAGSRKVMDCEFDMTGSFCTSCEPGEDYTDEPNSSNECKKCTVCNANSEDTESRCTTRQDTRCRCKDGFQRAASSDPCTDAKRDADVAEALIGALIGALICVVIGAVGLLILLVVTVGLLLYKIRHGRFPWESSRPTSETASLNSKEERVNANSEPKHGTSEPPDFYRV